MGELIIRPHPERETPEVRRLRLDLETDAVAMRIVIEHEATQGRQVYRGLRDAPTDAE
jgi:hypothetical protein